jgi:hypothetical protein
MFNDLRWEVIVAFVDIGGIVDHHCLNFLFIIKNTHYYNNVIYMDSTIVALVTYSYKKVESVG